MSEKLGNTESVAGGAEGRSEWDELSKVEFASVWPTKRESDGYVTPLPLNEQETPQTEMPVIEGYDQETGQFKDDGEVIPEVTPKPENQPVNEQTVVMGSTWEEIEESNRAVEKARAEMGDEGFRESEAYRAQVSRDAADFANGAFDLVD